ncbi:hypothetical protein LCGC14_2307010, partial [marine sediment metagenome]
RQAHTRTEAKLQDIRKAEKNWESLDQEFENVQSKHDDDIHSAYEELEPIAIDLENAHYLIGEAYAPLLKEIAVVHILCTATLEAHINSVAKDMLQGKEQNLFQRLSLEAKWLFLPKLLGFSGFNPVCEPFQSFARLLGYRNKLIHYKELKEKWVYGSVPQFINRLGLTVGDSRKSIAAVVRMIRELAEQQNIDSPYWLREDLNEMSYFDILSD